MGSYLHTVLAITGIAVIDTMGIDARIKSILSDYHGRYHTIGFADMRAVSIDMTPIYSGVCR